MARSSRQQLEPYSRGAVGATTFAAVMMMMIGVFHMINGLTALLEDDFFATSPNYPFEFNLTTWGWTHLIAGAIVLAAAFGLFRGVVWARTVGVFLALLSAIEAFLFLPFAPMASSLLIATDIVIIWALTVHGRDITVGR